MARKNMTSTKPELTLYPTYQRLSEAIARLVRGDQDRVAINPGMMTMYQFERKLQVELTGPAIAISDFGRAMLINKVIDNRYKNVSGGIFRRASGFAGFLESALAFFDELGAGLVDWKTLEKIKGYAPGKDGEIAAIYRDYCEELARKGLSDSGFMRREIVEALDGDWTSPTLSRFGSIRIEDIYQFTPYRFELFRKLARVMPVTIVMPAPDTRKRAFGFVNANLDKFEALGDKEGKLDIQFSDPVTGPLSFLAEKIFDLDQDGSGVDDPEAMPVTIMSCSSRYREIEEVGFSILREREKRDLQWSDFAVVFRDLRRYGAILEDVFNRYSIPFFFKRGLGLALNPLVRSVMSIFTAIDSGYCRDDIVRIVNSPYFARFSKIDTDTVQRLYLTAGIIEGSRQVWKGKMKKAVTAMKGNEKKEASKISNITSRLLDMLEKLKTQGRPDRFFDGFHDILAWLMIDPEPQEAGKITESIRFRDHNAYMQLLETIAQARQAASLFGTESSPIGYARLLAMLQSQIDKRSVPEPGTVNRNRVQALNIHDIPGLRFDTVFICGLHDGEFPLRHQSRSILTEDERIRFNKRHRQIIADRSTETSSGRRVFDSAQEKWSEESLLFFQAITSARENLTLAYSLVDLDSSPLARSQFVDDTLEALSGGAGVREREKLVTSTTNLAISRDMDEFDDPEETLTRLLLDIFTKQNDEDTVLARVARVYRSGAPKWKRFNNLLSLASTERRRDRFFRTPDHDARLKLADQYLGLLNTERERIVKITGSGGRVGYSPTSLEKYGQCPFRYFASAILGLAPEDEPSMEASAKDMGSMAHEIAERFYHALISSDALPLCGNEKEKKSLRETARGVFKKYETAGKLGDPLIWDAEKEKILYMLDRWLEGEVEEQGQRGYVPVGVETKFSFDGKSHSPLLINPPGSTNERYLKGIIDRIDINQKEKAVRIIDYKLSSARNKYMEMLKDENLGQWSFQAPVYALLAREYVLKTGVMKTVNHAGGGYRLFKMESSKGYCLYGGGGRGQKKACAHYIFDWSEDAGSRSQKNFERAVAGVIERIEGGEFVVWPRNCQFCDFAGLCRYIATPRTDDGGD